MRAQHFLNNWHPGKRFDRQSHLRVDLSGCYSGRWPHIHFEVYPSLATAVSVANKIATSQIAMQKSSSDLVYATAGYEASIPNLSQVTLASDMVFSDGASLELPTMSGSVVGGLTAAITVAV